MMEAASNALSHLAKLWHGFWFSAVDPIVVSFLRLFVGGMLFYTVLVWGVDLEAFFLKDGGWQSEQLVTRLQQSDSATSLWWLVPDDAIWLFHCSCLVIVAMFWMGLATTVTKWLALAIIISYANRVPLANYGLDQVNVMLTLYLCLGPCGDRLSVDRMLKDRFAAFRRCSTPVVRPSITAGFSVRMIQIHMCIIYFWAGLSKLQGVSWWNGQAVWRAAANYEYQQLSLTWLAEVPWLYQVSTIGTWVWEISFAFLIWNRYLRLPVLLIGLSMHLGIGMFMGMWTFGLIMCFAYISFIPDRLLASVLTTLGITSMRTPLSEPLSVENPVMLEAPAKLGYKSDEKTIASPRIAGNVQQRANIVVFIEPNLRNRLKLSECLKESGYQCIGVDAWPEAIDIFRSLGARTLICNATHLAPSELYFWVSRIEEDWVAGQRNHPLCVALVKPKKNAIPAISDDRLVVAPLPVSGDDLAAILDGHVPMHIYDELHPDEATESKPETNGIEEELEASS